MGNSILTEIITLLVGGIKGMAQGIGEGLTQIANSIFLQVTGEGAAAVTSLSTFGTMIIIFAAVSLAIGLVRWGLNFFTSLGARNR